MTDEKFVFIEDLRDRKSVSRGSLHKKRGSKSKKCTLPSDFLTPAQKRKMNGEVNMYKIGQPISWQEFKSYPQEMRQKWVDTFYDQFGCATGGMSLVFGLKPASISYWFDKNGVTSPGKSPIDSEKKEKILAWMNGEQAAPVAQAAPVVKAAAPVVKTETMPYFVNVLKSGTLSLEGDTNEICQTLFGIFREAKLHLDISFTVVDEPKVVVEADEVVPEEEPVQDDDGLLNLNTARFDELRRVGLSPNLAAQVVSRRRDNPFESKEELKEIVGLSEDHYNRLEGLVRV